MSWALVGETAIKPPARLWAVQRRAAHEVLHALNSNRFTTLEYAAIVTLCAVLPMQSSNAFDEKPQQHMDQLVDWLRLDPALTNRNSSSFGKLHERSYPTGSLPSALFQELIAFFQPHNERAFALLQQQGYGGLVQQLRRAWQLELTQTVATLQQNPVGSV